MSRGRILIVGLGNPILGDDGVGWHVAAAVKRLLEALPEFDPVQIDVDCLSVGGLGLMERMAGYAQAIILDAVMSGRRPLGSVCCHPLSDLPRQAESHTTSAHDTSLQNALDAGRLLGVDLPETVWIVGIECCEVNEFSEELSPLVAAAVDRAASETLDLLKQDLLTGCIS